MKNILAYFSLLLLFACQEDAEQIRTSRINIFNFNLENYTTDSTYHWAIVSDSNGEILSFSRLETDSAMLETELADIPDKVNITLVNISQSSKSIFYTIESYLDVLPADTWNLRKFSGSNLRPKAPANLQIINYPNGHPQTSKTLLSSAHGGLSWSGIGNSAGDMEINVYLSESPTNLLLTYHEFSSTPHYLNIPEAQSNQSYSFDYNESFKPADHILHISFPENLEGNVQVQGLSKDAASYKSLAGHTLSRVENFGGNFQEFYIGYLDGYPYYHTDWGLRLQDKFVNLEKIGTPPLEEDFQMLPHDFTITNEEFSNFSYAYQENFDYRYSVWQKNETLVNKNHRLQWTVHAPISTDINKVLLKFPEEIKEQFPYLENLTTLVYKSSTFIDYLDGKYYNDFIYEEFKKTDVEIPIRKTFSVIKSK